jgi:hypothetical protein
MAANIARILWSTVTPGEVALIVNLTSVAGLDFTTVVSATLYVERGNGTVSDLPATITGTPTATTLQLTHPWVAGDLYLEEVLKVTALLTVSGQSVPVPSDEFKIVVTR